jgi:hypothetical protein
MVLQNAIVYGIGCLIIDFSGRMHDRLYPGYEKKTRISRHAALTMSFAGD